MTRKKLIEVALPLEAINVASAREKSIRHGHPSTLHLWFARRPLAACRAVIFASLVDDPDSSDAPKEFVEACRALPAIKNAVLHDTPRQRLFDFIEKLVLWESTTDEKVLEDARRLIRLSTNGNPPPLLDPFAGGGSIPLEAQRLGLEAHASDLNPIPVIINKAMIEIPPRFANRPAVNPKDRAQGVDSASQGATGLAADVRYYGAWMRDTAFERIGHLYPKCNGETVIAWIWARTVMSPNPAVGVHVPLVNSFELSKKPGRKAWIEPHVDQKTKAITYEVRTASNAAAPKGTVDRKGGRCLISGIPIPFDYIRAEGKAGRMGAVLTAIITEGGGRRNYYSPTEDAESIANVAIPSNVPDTYLPEQALGFRIQAYGMTKHRDLFTPRQLVALTTFSDLVAEARDVIQADAIVAGMPEDKTPLREGGTGARAYAEAVSVYLSFAVDRLAIRCNSLVIWQNVGDKVAHIFGRPAISFIWDYPEVNPFSSSTGSFTDAPDWVAEVLESTKIDFSSNINNNSAVQHDAGQHFGLHNQLISTDPPYYDNIGYADLSDFFYIWLRRSLREIYPSIFATMATPKESELIATPFRFGGSREAANKHFESGLLRAFANICETADPSYPVSIYYAFKQSESEDNEDDDQETFVASTGWETMLEGLIQAGFTINGTLPIRTERSGGLRNLNRNSLASSIVLVCRPRAANAGVISRREFVDLLRREMPYALKELQSGNIAPVDLAQASIGPGMAIYSRYSKVLEADGSPLSVRTALGLINTELDSYLAEQEGDTDIDTRFAVAWFEQYGFESGEFGVADVLARAKNTSVEGVARAGIIDSARGKVRLLTYGELEPSWVPIEDDRLTVWEGVHHLIARLNTTGESGASELLALLPGDLGEAARTLTYRLYNICERKGWADLGYHYNALILSWTQVGQLASEARRNADQSMQQRLFE